MSYRLSLSIRKATALHCCEDFVMFCEDGTVALSDSATRVDWILDLGCCKELLHDPWYQKV